MISDAADVMTARSDHVSRSLSIIKTKRTNKNNLHSINLLDSKILSPEFSGIILCDPEAVTYISSLRKYCFHFSQSSVVGCRPQKERTVDAFYKQQDDFMLNLAIKESLKAQCAEMHTQYEESGVNWLEMLQGKETIPPNIPEYSGEVCKENQSSGLALLVDAVNMINE